MGGETQSPRRCGLKSTIIYLLLHGMESVTLWAFLALGSEIRCLLERIHFTINLILVVGNRLSWLLRLALHVPHGLGLLPQAILAYALHLLRDLHAKSFLLFVLHANLLECFALSGGHYLFFNDLSRNVKHLLLLLMK